MRDIHYLENWTLEERKARKRSVFLISREHLLPGRKSGPMRRKSGKKTKGMNFSDGWEKV